MRDELYYDIDGNPITMEEWSREWGSRKRDGKNGWSTPEEDPTRIGLDQVGESKISTVWLGLDHGFMPDTPPIIFETLVFGGPLDEEMQRYSTKEQAFEGHKEMVKRVKEAYDVLAP